MNTETLTTFNCEFCGFIRGNQEAHDMSVTHAVNQRKKLQVLESTLSGNQQNKVVKAIWDCDDIIKDLECGNSITVGGNCNYKAKKLNDLLEHEKTCCFGEVVIRKEICPKVTKKVYSSAKATCKMCGKVYLHTSKNITPAHSLNRHQKTCEQNLGRNLRGELNQYIKDLDIVGLKQALDYFKSNI